MIDGVFARDGSRQPDRGTGIQALVRCAPWAAVEVIGRTSEKPRLGSRFRALVPVRSLLCSLGYLGRLRSWPVPNGLT
jgi:hypothetical protein